MISTSGALGDKAKIFLNDALITRLDPRDEIGFNHKLMSSIAFKLYNHICTETISYIVDELILLPVHRTVGVLLYDVQYIIG